MLSMNAQCAQHLVAQSEVLTWYAAVDTAAILLMRLTISLIVAMEPFQLCSSCFQSESVNLPHLQEVGDDQNAELFVSSV